MSERTLSRRQVLGQTSAASAAMVLPAVASAAEPSPLRALYHRRKEATLIYGTSPDVDDTPKGKELLDFILACDDAAARFTPRTVEDFAWKVIFAGDDGDYCDGSIWAVVLVGGAYSLVGLPIPEGVLRNLAYFRPFGLDRLVGHELLNRVDEFLAARG